METFFITCGTMCVPEFMLGKSAWVLPWKKTHLALTIAVCRLASKKWLLVDVGWSHAACEDPKGELGRYASTLGLRVRPEDSAVHQLRELGIEARDVRYVVATHLHLDHIGGVQDFPSAELVCTRDEWEGYRAAGDSKGYRRVDLAGFDRIRLIDFDPQGRLGFDASHDLFGDTSVVLLEAAGHTCGSTAVALRSGAKTYLHVGDAVYSRWEYRNDRTCLLARLRNFDPRASRRARRRILEAERSDPSILVVPSHDQSLLDELPRARIPATSHGSASADRPR